MKTSKFFIDEVVQSSTMDCGPAALASLLRAEGIPVSYPRLRESCHTDVDGTSIDTLEELACRYGVNAEQVMLPVDMILQKNSSTLPCIAVTQQANGMSHFVTAYSCVAGRVQCMDPAIGRRWLRKNEFLDSLYQHRMPVSATDWRDYAGSEEFQRSLMERLDAMGFSAANCTELIASALADPDWKPVARLDAAIRYAQALSHEASLSKKLSREALRALISSDAKKDTVPAEYYQVTPIPADPDHSEEEALLMLKGAILVRVLNSPAANNRTTGTATAESRDNAHEMDTPVSNAGETTLGRTIERKPPSLFSQFRRILPEDLSRGMLLRGLFGIGAIGTLTLVEALIFRYLLNINHIASYPELALMTILVALPLLAGLLIERGDLNFVHRLGRLLDTHLRLSILEKLPRLPESYFSSRLVSDLAERGHAITELRQLPELIRRLGIALTRLMFIITGLIWVLPQSFWIPILMGAMVLASAFFIYSMLTERDLRTRTHLGALSRFYLDSLRGSEAIWSHGAENAMSSEQEELLTRWWHSNMQFLKPLLILEVIQSLALGLGAAWLIISSLHSAIPQGTVLLIAYWALLTPFLSREILGLLRQLPGMRSIAVRVFEILDADSESPGITTDQSMPIQASASLSLEGVDVVQGEVAILKNINLRLEAGEKIAIVGASGSGKSSLISLLLGWQIPTSGNFFIDETKASVARMIELREKTVWLDPDVYLWNRSAIENLMIGHANFKGLAGALHHSEFIEDLHRMPEGLATRVGENGSRLSGGESQRLRTARALLRKDVRLVLMDEPFRGMPSQQREKMTRKLSQHWSHATQIFISHDISDTLDFPRVLVMQSGSIVEDGSPRELMKNPEGAYSRLMADEQRLKKRLLHSNIWRHMKLEQGAVQEVGV